MNDEEFHVKKIIRFKQILCIILGLMILILPMSIYTLTKDSLTPRPGVIIGESGTYYIMLVNGFVGIISGIIFAFLMGKNRYLDYILICALGILLVYSSSLGFLQIYYEV
jgi:hypothetical protein